MPNIKGMEAGHPLRLMPWQRLVFANLFGFVEPARARGGSGRRGVRAARQRQDHLCGPAGAVYDVLAGEGGAERYAAAVTRDQARIMFDAALNMVRRSPEFRRFAKRRLLAGLQYVPRVIVAGKLRSYGVDQRRLLPAVEL